MHNQPGPAAQQNEQQTRATAPHATDEQVAAGIAAAAALDPVLRSLYPSEVRAIYAAMVEAGAPHAPAQSLALTAFIQDVEAAEEIDVQATPENGREANEQGFYEHQCPFPSDSCEADQWRQEWRDAQIDRELWEDENFYRAKATGAAA